MNNELVRCCITERDCNPDGLNTRFTGMITRLAQHLADTLHQDEIICELLNNNTIVRTWGISRRTV